MIIPKYLNQGDVIGIIAPAKRVERQDLEYGIGIIKNNGFRVSLGRYVYNQYGAFAGKDSERLEDLQSMIDDHRVKAILCARPHSITNFLL